MNLCARALRAGVFAGGRSVIPWDLVVQRVGGLLYLDVRDGCSLYDTTVCVCACVRACVRCALGPVRCRTVLHLSLHHAVPTVRCYDFCFTAV